MKNSIDKKTILIVSFFCLLLISCEEKALESADVNCFFQYEYVNYAWGYNHSGFTVTPSGEIYKFDKTTPWVFAEKGQIQLSDLLKNISISVKSETLISKTDMQSYLALATIAKTGTLSTPFSRGADMGAMVCKVFVPDETDPQNVFEEVILKQTGDWEKHNLKPEAAVISAWLTNLRPK
jgi:hypothetical protein